jgi:hypothetical protein
MLGKDANIVQIAKAAKLSRQTPATAEEALVTWGA